MKRKEESEEKGMLVYVGWAVVYKDRPQMKWDRKLQRRVPEKVEPETFFKEDDSAPRVFRRRQSAERARDELASRFPSGIWRVVRVELREAPDAIPPSSVEAEATKEMNNAG